MKPKDLSSVISPRTMLPVSMKFSVTRKPWPTVRQEGIQRSQTRDNEGNWVDLYLYGILPEDR